MPIIRIDFDGDVVSEDEIRALSVATQAAVSRITAIEDVFVYANSSQIRYKVAPIEIFVELSAHKIKDADALLGQFSDALGAFRKESGFKHKINLSLIPMPWRIKIGI